MDETITQAPFINYQNKKEEKVRKTSPHLDQVGGSVRLFTRCLFDSYTNIYNSSFRYQSKCLDTIQTRHWGFSTGQNQCI